MARAWHNLIDQAERNAKNRVVYEPPLPKQSPSPQHQRNAPKKKWRKPALALKCVASTVNDARLWPKPEHGRWIVQLHQRILSATENSVRDQARPKHDAMARHPRGRPRRPSCRPRSPFLRGGRAPSPLAASAKCRRLDRFVEKLCFTSCMAGVDITAVAALEAARCDMGSGAERGIRLRGAGASIPEEAECREQAHH